MAMAIGLYQSCMASWPVWRLTTDSKQRVPNGDMARMAAVPFLVAFWWRVFKRESQVATIV